jgi:hypothetical protein
MGAKYIASLPSAGRGGGVNVPGFQSFAEDLLNVTRSSVASWLTIVPDTQRAAFEAAALAAALAMARPTNASNTLAALARLARQVEAYGIRAPLGSNSSINDGSAPTDFQRAQQSDTYVAGATARRHACSLCPAAALCHALRVLRCVSHFRLLLHHRSRRPARATRTAWATAPRSNPRVFDFFLFDALSDPLRAAALRRARETSLPAMTDFVSWTFADAAGTVVPSSIVYAPAWVYANNTYGMGVAPALSNASDGAAANLDNNPGDAFCAIAFHWAAVLQDALPRFVSGAIVAVLRSPSGGAHTFSVRGHAVLDVGPGDRHGALVNGMAGDAHRLDVSVAGDQWSITLFPTPQARCIDHGCCPTMMRFVSPVLLTHISLRCVRARRIQLCDRYVTAKPLQNAFGIAAAVLFCALVFWCACFSPPRGAQKKRGTDTCMHA